MIHHLAFATLLLVVAVPLWAAFAPAEIATLRRLWSHWRLHRRVRRYAAAFHRDGVDLVFGFAQLAQTRTNKRIRTYPRHRLSWGRA